MSQNSQDLRSDQLAPQNIEAEEAVLGAILINADSLYEVLGFLRADDFFIVRHAWIWQAMMNLHERHDPLDYLTVVNELEQSGQIDEVGGAAYILSLVNNTPSALNVEGYGRIVERMAIRRRLLEAAGKIARTAHSEETDIDKVVANSEQAIFDVTRDQVGDQKISSIKNVVKTVVAKARAGEISGYKTGLDLHDILRGYKNGEEIIIAARPGVGKTSAIVTETLSLARAGVRAAFVTLEMSDEDITRRYLTALTGIPYELIREGSLDEKQWENIDVAQTMIESLDIELVYKAGPTIQELETDIQRLVYERGTEIVFVDYLQLINSRIGHENTNKQVGYISQVFKEIARRFNIPVVLAAQLSRKLESRQDKRPILSDLRDSGEIEQNMDVCLFLFRDSYYHEDSDQGNITEFNIAKHRNGATGMKKQAWVGHRMIFKNAAKEEFEL